MADSKFIGFTEYEQQEWLYNHGVEIPGFKTREQIQEEKRQKHIDYVESHKLKLWAYKMKKKIKWFVKLAFLGVISVCPGFILGTEAFYTPHENWCGIGFWASMLISGFLFLMISFFYMIKHELLADIHIIKNNKLNNILLSFICILISNGLHFVNIFIGRALDFGIIEEVCGGTISSIVAFVGILLAVGVWAIPIQLSYILRR